MKEIIVGTTNPAKVDQIRGALVPTGFIVKGVENKTQLPEVEEDGTTAVENARKKALIYAKALGRMVLSMDNALYFDELPKDQQPGLHVRRIRNDDKRPSDEELLEHYSKLVKSLGGKTTGYWEFGVCIAKPEGEYNETTIISKRIFTGTPSGTVVNGYPLESIQIDAESGKYISEMTDKEQEVFWQRMIGNKLCEFVSQTTF